MHYFPMTPASFPLVVLEIHCKYQWGPSLEIKNLKLFLLSCFHTERGIPGRDGVLTASFYYPFMIQVCTCNILIPSETEYWMLYKKLSLP